MAYTTINKSTDYFRTKLYTGNASNDRAITFDESTNMQPDFIWIKNRSAAQSHALFDAVRGATKRLSSNSSSAESTENTNLDSFDTNGFTVDNEAIVNGSGNNMVAWNWKSGGSGSSNTDGSITSSVSANTTAGFSIVSYTGTAANATVGHGLGSAPNVIFFKSRSNASTNWYVYHSSLGQGTRITLNSTGASASDTEYMNNTAPTSSVFSLGANGTTNPSSANQIAYCFAEKKGFSKFGSYIGNGSADGTFVYTGFKPAWVMTKCSSAAGQSWHMQDNKRDGFNYDNKRLFAESNSAESATSRMDLLSNGFKYRDGDGNTNGATYIFMAFAEEPLVANVGSGIPATAR